MKLPSFQIFTLIFLVGATFGCGQPDTAFTASQLEAQYQSQALDEQPVDESEDIEEDAPQADPIALCQGSTEKVLICHVPHGNPAARHTLCLSKQGATHGHGLDLNELTSIGGHGGDFLGACPALTPEPEPTPDPSPEPAPTCEDCQ